MDASGMNPATAAAFEGMMQQKQMKDFMALYQNLVERCFNNCCNDFTSKALSSKEEYCVNTCADKFLKHSERVGLRFSEANAEMMAKAQQRS
ncbi:protein transporter TIM9 [Sporobolomyces koalae]|uniref:protein transporter TIM9 n=1 Tax=Sporobolomyces koalae TaxID=500713 RepID=UPI00316F13C7